MCACLNYTSVKETFKKVVSDILSLEHKKFPVIKEKVETINFHHYKYANKKRLTDEKMEQISMINKEAKNNVLNVILHNILYVTVLIRKTILTLSWNQTRYI